ncbi:Intradiol ring-cleavage dioxygenase [Lasiosphaeria ovina]|uniref:Intradiol ring-cleavage dioxygenase n=1 Tax=Lasiosphaeria ovina TaxID=92902 RepID=A0AAE0NAY2_9PEZI|nr:Intradiol ring-cleavage dioxygenase [Lasiosphaeria ovina]
MHFTSLFAGALAGAVIVSAHPGHDHEAELAARGAMLSRFSRRDLSHCAEKIKARGLHARSVKRRTVLAADLMKKAHLRARDLDSLLNTTHHSTGCYTIKTPPSEIFAANNSCILSPEVTEGPYYVAGEYIRRDVVESQKGVNLTLDIQVLDTETCEPVAGAFLEIWHTNATGVYSGVAAAGNGNSDVDTSNINATYLRGVQQTDTDGVVQFATLFPGHYTGRTTHIHVMVHTEATAQANGTLLDTTASHVGQLFFDQELIGQVEASSPYAANTQALMTNAEDGILAQEAATSDPFLEYVLLGSAIEDGLLGWISFGINSTLHRDVSAAVTLTEDGGVANPNAGSPGGPGGPPPTGGFPGAPGSTGVPTATAPV